MFKHFRSRALTSTIVTAALAVSVISFAIPADAAASWNIVSSPNTSTTQHNVLYGVTCVSASDCWAVGYYTNSGGYEQTLIEQWNGTSWSIVSSPNTSTTQNNYLYGVACVSASGCWAVGSYCIGGGCGGGGVVNQTLIEQYNGTSWSIVTSPNTSTTVSNMLTSVTCVSASDCWAVGTDTSSGWVPLIEQWSGTSWSIVTAPGSSMLYGVTCVSASDCWAVGGDGTALVEQYNGTSWSIVTAPTTGSQDTFSGVACTSSSDCWAVGAYSTGSYLQTLIEQWNGTSWSIVSSPNTSTTENNFLSSPGFSQIPGDTVTCVSASDCVAAGYYYNGSYNQTLAEEWNGTSWSIVSSPNTSTTQNNVLNGVSCVSASDCIAAGAYTNAGSYNQTLIEQTSVTLQATVPVNPGTLSFVTTPANFSFTPITLNGFNQTATASQALDIGDNTGSGSGWNVTLSNTTFTSGSNTMANADFTAASPAVPTCDTGVTCGPATWSGTVTYPFTLPGATATKLLSTAANTGMANQTATIAWSAAIPAGAMAGTYTSTWTITLVSGP